jgi:hypothetical protein
MLRTRLPLQFKGKVKAFCKVMSKVDDLAEDCSRALCLRESSCYLVADRPSRLHRFLELQNLNLSPNPVF